MKPEVQHRENSSLFGYAAIIGPANAGKSTLLNSLVEDKVSIVSNKPHTTRQKILGIKTILAGNVKDGRQGQIVFVDTPGFAHVIKRGSLKEVLNRSLKDALKESDITILVLDSSKICDESSLIFALGESEKFIKNVPNIVVLNKIDLKPQAQALAAIQIVQGYFKRTGGRRIPEIIPVSAVKKLNLDRLLEVILSLLPEGEIVFPSDKTTDQTDKFFISELIREKVFVKTREEIPYSTAVVVERIKHTKGLMTVDASIIVEKEGQKGIIIGRGGQALKTIGTEARLELEEIYGTKVNLQLAVKVEKGWSETEKGVRKVMGE